MIEARLRESIRESAKELVAKELYKVLNDIPVEEINRDRKGIRTKALRDHGYRTIADLSNASVYAIATVHGISSDTAYDIKDIVNEIVDRTKKTIAIRLNLDDKTAAATNLVSSLYRYKYNKPHIDICRQAESMHKDDIKNAIEATKPLMNPVKWFFTTGFYRQKAETSYKLLQDFIEGEYGEVIPKELDAIWEDETFIGNQAWEDYAREPVRYYNILEEIVPGLFGAQDQRYGLPEDLAREIEEECFFPDGLLCELRRYQEWGVKYILHQEKVLLGDEMGLGKTIQAIAAMVSLRNTGATHFIVVCPASVLTNWCREIRKMSRLSVIKVHGTGRAQAIRDWVKNGGVAVTTYETTGHFKLDDGSRYSMLVVDEAHYIKNPSARRSVNVRRLAGSADRLLFMTGTALENKVDEMIELISILQPRIAEQARTIAFMSSAPQFREAVVPVYYRRKREDVLSELPELIETEEWCSMSMEERSVYERAVLSKNHAEARRVSWNIDDISRSSKAKRLLEIIEEAESEGRKILVFSFYLETIKKVVQFLGDRCCQPINGSVSPQKRQDIIDRFDASPAGTVLPAQIQAGGTGLNIQSASIVILCEPQLKPSIENQAISRAYRMGQTRNVLVYRLLCENTVDEKITQLLAEKQAVFDAFADVSVAARESLELDEKTFGNIIQEEIDRINANKAASEEQS